MEHYYYKCFDCKKEYSSAEVEKDRIYLCPECGVDEKNMPLKGILKVYYDYGYIKKNLSRTDLLNMPVGEFWNYPYIWPLKTDASKLTDIPSNCFDKIALNSHPLVQENIEGRKLYFFDETRNPTLSFKDRATNLVVLKALQMGMNEISVASTGNAGSSLAGVCSKIGLQAHVFVPKNIPEGKLIQIKAYGANTFIVDGDYDMAFDLCQEVTSKKGWFNRNTAYNPLTIEGKKSAAYDIFISLKGKLPDYIFVPVGDGVIISGLYKGFKELLELGWIEKLPSLIGVQSAGSNALIRYLNKGKFEYRKALTIADGICSGAPRNLYFAAEAVKESSGFGVEVTDKEISKAQRTIARDLGILVEPAASASYAGFKNASLDSEISKNSKILILLTGNGLKDTASLIDPNIKSDVKSYEEWKNMLL